MKKEESDHILQSLSQLYRNDLIYANFEMIHPGDAFGKIMIENLEVRFSSDFIIIYRIEDVNYLESKIVQMKIFRFKE